MKTIACTEVWGKAKSTIEEDICLAKLCGKVYSRPFGGEAGGDVIYLSLCAQGCLGKMLLADCAGHGEAVAQASDEFRSLLRKNINEPDNSALLSELNRQIKRDPIGVKFLTAVSATFNSKEDELVYAYAGHHNIFYYDSRQRRWSELAQNPQRASRNFPLGIISETNYVQDTTKFQKDDIIVFTSDGILELRNPQNEFFGSRRLLQACSSAKEQSPKLLLERILSDARDFSSGREYSDDVSLLIFQNTGVRDGGQNVTISH